MGEVYEIPSVAETLRGRAAVSLLERMEWGRIGVSREIACRCCGAIKARTSGAHFDDCPLVPILGRETLGRNSPKIKV